MSEEKLEYSIVPTEEGFAQWYASKKSDLMDRLAEFPNIELTPLSEEFSTGLTVRVLCTAKNAEALQASLKGKFEVCATHVSAEDAIASAAQKTDKVIESREAVGIQPPGI